MRVRHASVRRHPRDSKDSSLHCCYSRTTLAPTNLQDTITLCFFGIIKNQTHRRKQDIETLPILVSDLAGGRYEKYRFFVFNFGIKQVQIEQYILGSASP